MAASAWRRYNLLPEYIGDGTIDLDNDTFKCALFLSTSNCATLTHTVLANLTNQVANGAGYTTDGYTLLSVTWTTTGSTVTFDSADPQWTASGGSITARFAVIYKSGTANAIVNPLVAYCLLDTTPADVFSTDGNSLTIQMSASGIFTLSGGQA